MCLHSMPSSSRSLGGEVEAVSVSGSDFNFCVLGCAAVLQQSKQSLKGPNAFLVM